MIIAQEKPTMATVTKTPVTLEAYRAIAETSQERYEYCHGEMRRCQIKIGKMQCNPCYQSNFSSKLIRSIFQFDNAY